MKIAHLTTVDLSLRYLIQPQLEAARDLGPVYAISAPGPHVSHIEGLGIELAPLRSSTRGMSIWSDFEAMVQLWRALHDIEPDVLHTHNPKPGVYGRILGRLAGVPIVVNTVHGLYASPESSLLKKAVVYGLESLASRFSDAELVQNPEDLALMNRLRIAPRRRMRILGNGVDLSKFNPERARAARDGIRRELGITSDEVVLGFVGRLVEEKGIRELVDAALLLDPRPRILVAGPDDPDKSDSLTREHVRRAREAGVEFVGMRSDIDAFYGAIDLFVLPSYREGFPRAAMEAAASGLPLVVTDIRGCRQVVDDGRNGFQVPVRDAVALADAINTLVASSELRLQMGQESALKAAEEFDESRVVEIVMGTYRELALHKGLAWSIPMELEGLELRPARASDSAALAELHRRSITGGFLSTLPRRFLKLLYRTLIESERGHVFVAESAGVVAGFIAGTDDTGSFYREFIRRNAVSASLALLPALLRPSSWMRILETLRYGSGTQSEVRAELLAMGVAPIARRRGLGGKLIGLLKNSLADRAISEMRVTVGADNLAARTLYEAEGFALQQGIEVHPGVRSLEMVWRS